MLVEYTKEKFVLVKIVLLFHKNNDIFVIHHKDLKR